MSATKLFLAGLISFAPQPVLAQSYTGSGYSLKEGEFVESFFLKKEVEGTPLSLRGQLLGEEVGVSVTLSLAPNTPYVGFGSLLPEGANFYQLGIDLSAPESPLTLNLDSKFPTGTRDTLLSGSIGVKF